MPWLLQPKNYTQIARPNLYNVAYRRVGGYKGMGRLHPTNYLEIGPRQNRIGGTTGQYNTLSGQLMLLPPSLRGLGQDTTEASFPFLTSTLPLCSSIVAAPGFTGPIQCDPSAGPVTYQQQQPSGKQPWYQNVGLMVAIGVGLALLIPSRVLRDW
jgi:hypothetical protein